MQPADQSATGPEFPASPWRRQIVGTTWRITRWMAAIYVGILIVFMWLENSLIYFPMKYPDGDWGPQGFTFEDAYFQAADGTRLHGWYVPVENPSAVVLFCHGNAGNVTHRSDLMFEMQQHLGASILVFDYRGYGRSEGTPDEAGVLQDARAARAWLAQKAGIPEKQIVLMGESLGGAVAADLASRDGARGLVLEDTFTSLGDMAAYHYPWLPAKLLMKSRFDTLANIRHYQGPLLMGHGDADTIVPYALAEQLFAAANEPKQLITDAGADHNDPRSEEFYNALRQFLEHLPSGD